jgi:hypothetical protein
MRTLPLAIGTLAVLTTLNPLDAQEGPVVSREEMEAALITRAAGVDTDRAVVQRVLARSDVEAAARSAGMASELERARTLTGSLQGERLTRASAVARAIEVDLAGGQSVTFSTTTLIIILLLVIIIILIAD